MRFLRPDLGWWVLASVVALAFVRWRASGRFVASTTVSRVAAAPYHASIVRRLPIAVAAIAFALTGVALMQPVLPYAEAVLQSRGLDIVVVLDLSSSMQEPMERMRPTPTLQNLTFTSRDATRAAAAAKTRLAATKEAIKSFIVRRRDDRIALIVFSDNAYVISPLTFDHDYLLRYVDMVDDQILSGEGMTAIGDGLALANYLLARQAHGAERRNQVVVLFTDGENNKGRDPVEVIGESNAARIRVHMIGVDLEQAVREKPQVQRLFESVRRYGGRYFNASTGRDLEAASRTIDSVEKGFLVNRMQTRDVPVYHWFALPALVCLTLAIALRAVPFFVDQT